MKVKFEFLSIKIGLDEYLPTVNQGFGNPQGIVL